MEQGMQGPGLSSSEDESPSLVTRRPPWRKSTKHSTPKEVALGWSPRPPGRASHLQGSPLPAHSSQDLVSHLAGVSTTATFRKRRLSTIRDSEGSSWQLGSHSEPSAAGKDPPQSASSAKTQQEAEVLQPANWSQKLGLPGIPATASKKRRDPKGRAAVMQRVREWEARLLWDIEEATKHELTIQEEGASSTRKVAADAQEPASE